MRYFLFKIIIFMKILSEIFCPDCVSSRKKNGFKTNKKQNYQCKGCGRQFIGGHNLTYKGCLSYLFRIVLMLLVMGCGIRDISAALQISKHKVLSVLANSNYKIVPKHRHYGRLEVDEFWTFVGKKENKLWLIYSSETGEINCYEWGGRHLKTARRLQQKL